MSFPYLLKAVLVGEQRVGKSVLALSLSDHDAPPSYIQTIGIDIGRRSFTYRDSLFYLQLWDIAGEARFRSIATSCMRGATVFLAVFDKSDRESMYKLEGWKMEIEKVASEQRLIILYGNKKGSAEEVAFEEAAIFARKLDMLYVEGSAFAERQRGLVLALVAEVVLAWRKDTRCF